MPASEIKMSDEPALHTSAATRPDISGGRPRRGFLVRLGAILFGAIPLAIPLASGLVTFLDPLRKTKKAATRIRVASLDALPDDGSPLRFPIVTDRVDAWNRFNSEPIGAVFLRRTEQGVEALSGACPHAGCSVGFNAKTEVFECPCHRSLFELDGTRIPPSPSPSDMTTLPVDADRLEEGEVWIEVIGG